MTSDYAQSLAEISVLIGRLLPSHRTSTCVELAELALAGKFDLSRVPVGGEFPDSEDLSPYESAFNLAAALQLMRSG